MKNQPGTSQNRDQSLNGAYYSGAGMPFHSGFKYIKISGIIDKAE
jgi:hypothetical protein